MVSRADPELWNKWVAKLEDKGFFNGAPAGSQEHANRTKKALAKFKEKFSDVKPATVRCPRVCRSTHR
jgi:small glutamine-rich tetratricopeptide repeat-containing protein alpha